MVLVCSIFLLTSIDRNQLIIVLGLYMNGANCAGSCKLQIICNTAFQTGPKASHH